MILVCPECEVHYELPVDLPEGGGKVRCSSCSHVWHATADDLLDQSEIQAASDEATSDGVDFDEIDSGGVEAVSPFDAEMPEELDFLDSEIDEGDDNSQDDIDSLFDEPEADSGEDNSQDDIDSLFDEPEADEGGENSQDDIDGLFDEPGPDEGGENSQDDIDGLFDEPEADEGGENSQDDIDGLFDEPEADGGDDLPQEDFDSLVDEVASATAEPDSEFKVDEVSLPDDDEEEDKEKEIAVKTPEEFITLKQFGKSEIFGWAGYGLTLLLVGVLLIFARVSVVRNFPATASFYSALGLDVNVRGLMFTNLQQKWVIDNDMIRLQVEGEIINLTNNYNPVPKVVFGAHSNQNKEIFRWVASVREKPLLPGEQAPFLALLPPPPEQANHLMLKFER